MKQVLKYLHLWKKLTSNSFMSVLTTRFNALIFLLGKSLRFIFFLVFLGTLFSKTQLIAQYTALQAMFFYLTYNIVDTTTQLFFREVYRFRPMIVSGDFDLVLVKPINPLFRALAGGADPLDLFMLVPYIGALAYTAHLLRIITITNVSVYMLLLLNGILIAAGFHILVLALAILTTEIDHAIMIYRDLTSMGRVPVEIYRDPLRSILTFVVPVGIMMTFPAKAFLGLLSFRTIAFSCFLGVAFVSVCYRVWKYSLSRYSSASS